MNGQSESLGLSGAVTPVLRDLIHEQLGLFYEADHFDQLADRLAPLVVARGLSSFMDYYYLLKYCDDREEWGRVMDALAVQETYFWREIDQVRAVVDHVLPGLVRHSGGRPLRIWSIPCATGEEPLTLAMMLDQRGWFDRAAVEIMASDASPAAIAKAEAGHYRARSFRNLAPDLHERYFTATGTGKWTVAPELQRRVTYDVVNLMDSDSVTAHARVPVVFCRNVFIYFSERSIRRAVDVFADAMTDPAFLCVGASESLLRLATRFELKEIGGAFMYAKPETTSRSHLAVSVRSERI